MNASRGWEIYPQIIFDMAMRIKNDYRNIPWFVAESGMGVENEGQFRNREGVIDDSYRIRFISEHLWHTLRAREAGANCQGYMLWAFTDNVSPMNAFKNRYGLIEIDLQKPSRPGDPKPRRTGFVNWANGVNWCWISMMNTASRGQYLLR
ncbi:beta-glucosidase [Klebsiella pneumoniae subsp. rhinoscleromatis]|nr:beta-glucosidase [Klebsiella pneumoniae subsp. rhinoscleromatis]